MPVQYKDYYKILGVSREASDVDIKKAFRKLAREFHPDVAKDKKRAEERFKEINEAYEVLGDAPKRKKYDELGANWASGAEFRPPPGWGRENAGGFRGQPGRGNAEFHFGGTGFSDFFEQFFGGGRGQRGGFGGVTEEDFTTARGRDIEGDIMVALEEAMRGSVRSVTVRRNVACPACGGTGQRGRALCDQCGGTGQTAREDTWQVKIPAGVTEGQRLRVSGHGESGSGGGKPGDLYLRVRLARHPEFEVEGSNIVHELEIAPWEAVLGASISVPTLDSSVNIKIPAGTRNEQKLRVRGHGLSLRGGGRGDLIVQVSIETPHEVTESERKLWEQLAKESKFNPRA